jgi:hypothetical protein
MGICNQENMYSVVGLSYSYILDVVFLLQMHHYGHVSLPAPIFSDVKTLNPMDWTMNFGTMNFLGASSWERRWVCGCVIALGVDGRQRYGPFGGFIDVGRK